MKPLLVFIHGPTGSGKTNFAVQAAQQFGAEIINCDSVQVYRSLNIGAAKPSAEQLASVRHHLVGHVDDNVKYTAGNFRRDALSLIESRSQEGQDLFFVVGGSGFYSQALLKGMFPIPPADPEVREKIRLEFEKGGLGPLYQQLHSLDPEYAEKVGANDSYRIVRALEILQSTEFETMGDLQSSFDSAPPPFRYIQIGFKHLRSRLREKIEARTQAMLKDGLIEETRLLLEQGLGDWPALRSVGYQEACDFLSGRVSEKQLHEKIVTSTMQLAKRQMTWFRRDSRIHWFDTDFDPVAALIHLHESTRRLRLDRGLTPPDTKMTTRVI